MFGKQKKTSEPQLPVKYPTHVHRFLRTTHGVKFFAIAIGFITIIGTSLLILINSVHGPVVSDKIVVPKPKPKFYSQLTGEPVNDESTVKRPVTAIMIENSPSARPQSGLKEAGIVYEAVAEGGITRFIALYQESRPSIVGPVRSVRPYYVEWASAYDPSVVHIGGSARALEMIRSGSYGLDLDQFFNASSFWRANDREAPHNVYTDFDKLDALRTAKGKTTSSFTGFVRKESKKLAEAKAKQINIDVSSGSFHVEYNYDAADNAYARSHNGEPHTDREKGAIKPKVVIAIKVPIGLGFEDGNREQITTTGTGQAYVFQNGDVIECSWSRESVSAPLKLRSSDGKDVVLNPGQTWITALSNNRDVSWQ